MIVENIFNDVMGVSSEAGGGGGGGGDGRTRLGFATAFTLGRKDSEKKIMVLSLSLSFSPRGGDHRQESPFAFVLGMRSCHGAGMYRISKFGSSALLSRNSYRHATLSRTCDQFISVLPARGYRAAAGT